MSDQATAPTKRPKGRSPAYPSINIETAIQRARQLYDKERQHPTPVTTIAAHWGYKSLNGPAAQAIAALKKYGLLDDEGVGNDRKARLSSLADVILVHPDDTKRRAAIHEAALRPPIHRELWESYGQDLPSDSSLRWELTHDRGFTETGAAEFIRVYRSTLAFAQLPSHVPHGTQTSDDHDGEASLDADDGEQQDDQAKRGRQSGSVEPIKSYAIPLIGGSSVAVEGPFPITEQDWAQFIAVLNAMKPGLVKNEPEVAHAV